jgi:hypothetical protein
MSAETDAWSAWREKQVEADERDIPARAAYLAGWEAHKPVHSQPWHESLAHVLLAALILAAICYFLAGAPH